MGIYDRIHGQQNSVDANKAFKFSVTISENTRQRLENLSEILDAPRSILAGELIDAALLDIESEMGLLPVLNDGEFVVSDWTDQHIEYARKFHPVTYFGIMVAKGGITQEEFFSKVKIDSNGNLVLRDGGNL